MKGHRTHVAGELPFLVDGLVAAEQALGGEVLVTGVTLEPSAAVHLRNVASHESVVEKLLSTNPALFAQVTVKLDKVRSGLSLGGLGYHLVALRALGWYGHYQVLK